MPALELVPLETHEADAYWRAFVAGRNDQPTTNHIVHMERYLSEPPNEQRTYYAFREGDRIVGTVRLGRSDLTEPPTAITFFSLIPDARGWLRDAILAATEPLIAKGSSRIQASYDDSYSDAFTELGFKELFSRVRMEVAATKRDPFPIGMVHPEAMDVDDVASFLMAAYQGHMEQQFGMHVGTPDEWRDYVTSIWKGESGTYIPLASWLTRDETGIAGISLATQWMGSPLLAEIGIRQDRRRQGLGRGLLTATLNSLVDLGNDRLALYVTLGNDPALRLYEGMGFRQVGGRTVSALLEL